MKKYFIVTFVLIATMSFRGDTGRATAPSPTIIKPLIKQTITIESQISELGDSLHKLNSSYENR